MAVITEAMTRGLAGGVLIGGGAALLLVWNGRIAGITGILDRLVGGKAFAEQGWRIAFVIGLLVPAALWGIRGIQLAESWPWLATSGALVGFGTRTGSGCTSGHGVCGLSNLSQRSLIATSVFMGTAMVTVFVVRHILTP